MDTGDRRVSGLKIADKNIGGVQDGGSKEDHSRHPARLVPAVDKKEQIDCRGKKIGKKAGLKKQITHL